MKKMQYTVVGGQYFNYNYGSTPTLLGAKRLAGRNPEYWDNWAGWHVPAIYRAEDVEEYWSDSRGEWVTEVNAYPLCVGEYHHGKVTWREHKYAGFCF